jgi:hypothetical protein
MRIFATVPGYLFGRVPVGNTGGVNVSAIKPMPIPSDLQTYFSGCSVKYEMRKRVLIFVFAVAVAAAIGVVFIFASQHPNRFGRQANLFTHRFKLSKRNDYCIF